MSFTVSKRAPSVLAVEPRSASMSMSNASDSPRTPSMSAVSSKDRSRLAATVRRSHDDDDEDETRPLPANQKAAMLGKVLNPTRTRRHGQGLEGTCTAIDCTGSSIVVGCSSKLLVLDAETLNLRSSVDVGTREPTRNQYGVQVVKACTAVQYLPIPGVLSSVVLVAQGSNVLHVNLGSGKVLTTTSEGENKVYNLSIRPDGKTFATCGSDKALRLYDEKTGQLFLTMDHGDERTTAGHSNDVFGLAWQPDDVNMLVSGGWDNTIQVWDVRLGRSVRSIYGPYICGDSLDVKGNTILAGSWRHSHPLELWDIGSCKLLTRLPWFQPEQDACKLYAAAFGRDQLSGYIIAGGGGRRPCVKLFTQTGELIGTVAMNSTVQSIDSVGLQRDRFVSVCCSGEVQVLDLTK